MDLLRLEQQRQELEQSLQKLRQSLKYWQTFEAEYEGLKEEIREAQPDVSFAKLTEISESYEGELVTKQVVRELAGWDKASSPPRTGQQIIRDIERRQEYVQKNIEIIQRRFFESEAKLEEFDFAATRDIVTGLPLTEIEEELDEDDNVVSSRLTQPEEKQKQLVESLRKAGLTDEDLEEGAEGRVKEQQPLRPAITNASPPIISGPAALPMSGKRATELTSDPLAANGNGMTVTGLPERPPIRKKSVSFSADTKEPPEIVRIDSEDGKKSVSFAEKVAVAPAAPLPDSRTVQFSPMIEEIPPQPLGPASPVVQPAQIAAIDAKVEVQKELRASGFKPGDKVKTLNDDDEVVSTDVVLPDDEGEEDAQTRREMLDYHLNEVGHVVAQMDLDDGDDYNDDDFDDDDDDDTSSHFTGSTHLDDEDTPYTSGLSDEEDEDDFGRTKGKIVDEEYRKKMLEMEKRLIGNLGPAPEDESIADAGSELNPADVRRLVIRGKRSSMSSVSSDSSEKKAGGKKRVSFAEDLDVAEAEPGSPLLKAQKHVEGETAVPVSEIIVEKDTTAAQAGPGAATPGKASRFKRARTVPATSEIVETSNPAPNLNGSTDYEATPSGPAGKTLAETLIERPAATRRTKAPSADDDDPIAERRQLAAEYYRRRNDMIRQQGGFKANRDEDETLGEWMEEKDGKIKKVSRFKAARIQP